jgi:CubicO group peptidase (beta-lactamase class C family)
MNAKADAALRAACDSGDLPGVVAMATNGRERIYEGAFGRRSISDPAPMTLDTVFWIASMTKAVTSVAAMQQVEQGRLSLDEPMGELLPELARPQVLEGFDPEGHPRLRPARRPITLRHLLSHTAGFSYEFWSDDIVRYMQAHEVPSIASCENRTLTTPLLCDPGERWEYGINIDFAGKAVEKVTGQRLNAYLQDHVFAPLGMSDTSFVLRPDQRQRLAAMHARKPDGSFEVMPFEIPQEPEFFMGGGGLYSTVGDYIRFCDMFLHRGRANGSEVLKPETVAEMSRNQIGELRVGALRTVMPELSNDAEFFPGMPKTFSLAFLINTEAVEGGRSAGSLAWAGLANSYYWIDPTRQIAGVIMTQILPFADPKVLAALGSLERAVYAAA